MQHKRVNFFYFHADFCGQNGSCNTLMISPKTLFVSDPLSPYIANREAIQLQTVNCCDL